MLKLINENIVIAFINLMIITFLSSCSLAPKHYQPEINIPVSYKETGKWLQADPNRANLSRGPWWKMYNDPVLNALEEKVTCSNQNIKAAIARYDNARAVAQVARAAFFPSVSALGNGNRQKSSRNIANKTSHPVSMILY